MKDSFKRRRTKAEMVSSQRMIEEEKVNNAEYGQLKQFLNTKGVNPADIPRLLHQHDQMAMYLKEKEAASVPNTNNHP